MENEQNGLHLLYKNLGETPLETIERFKKNNPEYTDVSMTYAGRLDPMAEGLLLVLSGEAIAEKEKYLGLPKTYTFQMLWGVSTDSLDVLGLVSGGNPFVPQEEEVRKKVESSIRKFIQKYPMYSSKAIASRFSGKEPFPSSHEVTIHDGKFLRRESLGGEELLRIIKQRISLVTGDFRQKETVENWEKTIDPIASYAIDTVEVSVSSGFYIRQFVSDLAESCGTVGTTFHIKREKIGDLQLGSKDD